jgi:hypothetical protein
MACFTKIEEFGLIPKDLQLAWRTRADLDLYAPLGSGFAQAHGRASQIKSKQAASNFNHACLSTYLLQPKSCSRELLPCPARRARSLQRM